MLCEKKVLGVVPARTGSKGLRGKNLLPLLGVPLVGHAVLALQAVPEVDTVLLSTDSEEIADVGRAYGASVPFLRPAELAGDEVAMAPVIAHAVAQHEAQEGPVDFVVLGDPTSPARQPHRISEALATLQGRPDLEGVVAVSEPLFHPSWVGVRFDDDGVGIGRFYADGAGITRRQDNASRFLRINGSFYVWRSSFLRQLTGAWLDAGRHGGIEIDELHAFSIDNQAEFDVVRVVVESGLVTLPWLPQR